MGMNILVTGATGNVGARLVQELLSRGATVRVGVRNVEKARVKWGAGVEFAAFDFEHPETFAAAFDGVDRLFLVRPPAISDVKKWVFPAIDQGVGSGVRHIVFLSLLGVEKNPLLPHSKIETHVRASGAAYTFLRAGFFMQNLSTTHRSEIRDRDEIYVPAGRGRTSFVDVRDLAAVGAAALVGSGHENQAYDLTGPEALRYDDIAAILSDVLGREIRYADPSIMAFWKRMRSDVWDERDVRASTSRKPQDVMLQLRTRVDRRSSALVWVLTMLLLTSCGTFRKAKNAEDAGGWGGGSGERGGGAGRGGRLRRRPDPPPRRPPRTARRSRAP